LTSRQPQRVLESVGEGPKEHDAFEAMEMHDGARVVWRDKVVSRFMAGILAVPSLLVIGLAIFIASANATAPNPIPATALPFVVAATLCLGVMFAALGVVFGVLRTVVTERAVHVRYGLWGPTIPIASIRSCRVVDYQWTKFGGWGIRRASDGTWAYVMASAGRVLELRYVDGRRERRVLVGVGDAAETARQIEKLRTAAPEGGRVRVADEPPAEESAEVDEESGAQMKR
jgi:hypothetical protein